MGSIHETADIHPTAIVHSTAEIGANVRIGARTRVLAFAVIGGAPEHRDYWNDWKYGVVIGDGCFIGNHVTIDSGTKADTVLGNNVVVMNHSHVSHDCVLEDNSTVAGGVSLCGHVKVCFGAYVGAGAVIHQHGELRACSILSNNSVLKRRSAIGRVLHGNPARPLGINRVGLDRLGIDMETFESIIEVKYGDI